jgi:hypothetical protein
VFFNSATAAYSFGSISACVVELVVTLPLALFVSNRMYHTIQPKQVSSSQYYYLSFR